MPTPNIPGWTRLEFCPKTPGCCGKVVWKDADGNLFRLNQRNGDFVPHICAVRGSEQPAVAYLGEWFNTRTRRTRWIGPVRLRAAAKITPPDSKNDWELKGVHIAELNWKPVED